MIFCKKLWSNFIIHNYSILKYYYITGMVVVVVVVVIVSRIQRIGCQPEKLLYTVANPARGLLKREKRTR